MPNQAAFQEFTDKIHKQWLKGNSGVKNHHLNVLRDAYNEGLLNENDLEVNPIVLYSIAGLSISGIGTGSWPADPLTRTSSDGFELIRDGLLTINQLEQALDIDLRPYSQTGTLDTIMCDEGIAAIRLEIPIIDIAREHAKKGDPIHDFLIHVKELVADNTPRMTC